jgi:hypothetical protein
MDQQYYIVQYLVNPGPPTPWREDYINLNARLFMENYVLVNKHSGIGFVITWIPVGDYENSDGSFHLARKELKRREM